MDCTDDAELEDRLKTLNEVIAALETMALTSDFIQRMEQHRQLLTKLETCKKVLEMRIKYELRRI